VKIVRERAVRRQPERNEQRSRLAAEQRGRMRMRLARHEVGLGALKLERAQRCAGEVERRLGVTPSAQLVDRPDHASRTDIKVLHR
jgi:hypothetical protein